MITIITIIIMIITVIITIIIIMMIIILIMMIIITTATIVMSARSVGSRAWLGRVAGPSFHARCDPSALFGKLFM